MIRKSTFNEIIIVIIIIIIIIIMITITITITIMIMIMIMIIIIIIMIIIMEKKKRIVKIYIMLPTEKYELKLTIWTQLFNRRITLSMDESLSSRYV